MSQQVDLLTQVVAQLEEQIASLQARSLSSTENKPKSVKPNKPPTYNGTRDMSTLKTWIFSMKRYLTLTETPPNLMVSLASTFLVDAASTWYQAWEAAFEDFIRVSRPDNMSISWDDFVTHLTNNFKPPNYLQSLRDKWFNLQQTTSVSHYVSDFKAIRLQLNVTDDEALDKFVRGLKHDVRREVVIRGPTSLEEAINVADRYDQVTFEIDKVMPRPLSSFHSIERSTGVVPMEIDAMFSPRAPLPKLTGAERDKLRQSKSCFRCRQPGHFAANCPSRTYVDKTKKINAIIQPHDEVITSEKDQSQ
jgi:Retrotransposon gag protein/Zinc knuckle